VEDFKSHIINGIQTVFALFGVYLTKSTPKNDLINFISGLEPIESGKELIRLGQNSDGGYLVPSDLEGISKCFSPGVADVADFELEMVNRGIRCFLADFSVDQSPLVHPLLDFKKKFIGVSNSDQHIEINSWISENSTKDDELILQMDIEGDEYKTLLALSPELLMRFRILVIEFHNLHQVFSLESFKHLKATFDKLQDAFCIVHAHPNNNNESVGRKMGSISISPTIEMTFLRKNRIAYSGQKANLPHALDRPNNPKRKEMKLPNLWKSQ
jgi:hypothetical protein